MTDRTTIQRYVNDFRRHFSGHLKPGVGLACMVYPATEGGAILVFTIGSEVANEDRFEPASRSVNEALQKIAQGAFGGNLAAFSFRGTNTVAEGNRLIIIKGDDSVDFWSDRDAASTVGRLVSSAEAERR